MLAILLTWQDLLGIGGEGGFAYIQKYTGFISPGIVAVFLLGLFWKRTTAPAAIVGFVLSVFFNIYAPATLGHNTLLYTAFPNGHGGYEIPFLICMGLSFTFAVMVGMSLAGPVLNPKATAYSPSQFRVAPSTMGHDYRHAAAHHGPLRQVLVTLSSSLVLAPAPTGG